MAEPTTETIRFTHASARGRWWIALDLGAGTIAWKGDGETPRALPRAELDRVRTLAEAVRPEHASLQPGHLTYAQDESLEVHLAGGHVLIDASNGEICEGPPGALVEALHAVVRPLRTAAG